MEYISNGESGASARAKINAITQIVANEQADDYILVLSDKDKVIDMNKATAVNLTVPPNSSVAFTVGDIIYIRRIGVGTLTIVEGSGVTVTASSSSLTDAGQNVIMTLRKTGTNTWDLQNGALIDSQSFASSMTGFSSTTNSTLYYVIVGKMCQVIIALSGTSNSTSFTFTVPFNVKSGVSYSMAMLIDNAGTPAMGRIQITATSNIINVFATTAGGAFTASGTKAVRGVFWFPTE